MAEELRDLSKPSEFWKYFYEISKIPRCSGNERAIREYIQEEARKHDLETKTDDVGNLLVRIPPKEGKGDSIKIVLQAHMDMVCEKNEDITHDFLKDPLSLKVVELEGDKWIKAEGTTLGADNGVGIAFNLTLMEKICKGELNVGPLSIELLFTVDEETGLSGAFQMQEDFIEGNYLINLDSEEDDEFTIGCAGGIGTTANVKIKHENNKYGLPVKLSISGLLGGHSGVDIHLGRANAIKLMATFLKKIDEYFVIYINSINGGNRSNAIPRECQSIFYALPEDLSQLNDLMILIRSKIKLSFSKTEPNLKINIEHLNDHDDTRILPEKVQEKLINLLFEMPNGPISMHHEIPDLVHTSSNLASIKMENDSINIVTSQRSLEESSKIEISEKIQALFELADIDINIEHGEGYPGWEPNFNSSLVKTCKDTYEKLFNQSPGIKVIHAGLECGILKKRFPDMEMISIGPTIENPHSPDERLKIKSVEKFWIFLTNLLHDVCKKHYNLKNI